MSKNRSTWSALLAVVLAMVVMAGMAVTSFAVTDGEYVGNEHPDATIQQLTAALESGVLESGIHYDVDGNGIIENDDLKYLTGELVDAGDLLDQLTEESKAGLQSLIVKGDSTRALAMTGTQSLTLDFAAPVDLGSAEKLLIDTFWTSGNGRSFQVVFLSGDKETAPVTVTAGQAGWSVVEVPFDDPTGVIIGNVTGIRIILDEGDTTYFDNFRMEGASGRVKVTADGQVYRPAAGTTYGELPTPVKTFYTFGGWMLEGNLVEASAQIENDAVLEAKWTLVASDDGTVTVADRGNNAFGLTMDGAYRQIRFDFMLKSGDFYMSYADGDDIGYNNPVITIVDANGNAVSQSKVQPDQWYTAFIYGGSVKAVNGKITEIHDGARMATSGTLTISDGVQMQVRNLETLTGQFGIRVVGETPTLWQMTDSTTVVEGKPVNGYNYHKQQAAQYGSHWTFSIEANRYTKMTFELYIYELNGDSAKGRTTDLTLQTLKSNGVSMKKQPVVYDLEGNQVTTADVQTGTWYKVEVDMTGVSGTHYLYSTVSKGDEAKAGTYKAYIANANFVGDGTMIDNLSPATTVTVDKAGTDGTFVTTPVTRDTDRGTYRVAGTSAKWADRVIRVSRNDDTKELIQLDFRFVTSKDGSGKDVAPTLVASTGVSGALTQAQYIIVDENDNPVTDLETGKWYRMFITANGGNVFGLVPATTGEVELQVEGLDTFNTDELPGDLTVGNTAAGYMSAVLTRFGKLQYIYAGNGANTVTITLDSDLYKQIRFAAKSDSAISLTGATMEITGSGEWKNVVISNNGGNLPTTLTLNVGEGSLIIKDLVAYTSAEAPEEKTQSDIFRGLQDDEMMISGFLGPREEEHFYIARPDQRSNAYASLARDDIFKLIADVGINYISDNGVNYSGAGKENAQHILRLAAKYGINYFASATDVVEIGVKTGTQSVNYPSFLNPHDQVIYKSNIASADAIKAKLQKLYQYESFGGLYLKDEPTSDLFDEIQNAVTKINQAKQEMGDVTLNQYVNLLTWYNTTGALTNFQDYTSPAGGTAGISNKAITWEEYLTASVLDTGMNYFAFDIYPFNTDGLNSSFLNYLGMANYVAMNQTGTPWMGYAQVGGGVPGYKADKAITTEAELNWDVNAMLAFGAKGILYYINVTPPYAPYDTSSGMDPHSLIDASGTPTDYYGYVKDINAQIQAIDHVLMKSQHLGVIVNGSGACGYSESTGKTTLLNTTSELGTVKLSSVSGTALIGAFDYNGQTALLVMNNTTDNDGVADGITLNFTGAYSYEVIQDAVTAMSMGTSLNLSLLPGRCALVVVHDNLASTQVSFAGTEVTEEAKTVYVDFPYGNLPAPEREGYLFAGWFTDETYTTQVTAETVVTNSEAHTLYAKWLELCTVSFDLNYTDAGENPAAITPIKGDTYGELHVPEREGYTFLGWYTDTAYTQAVASNTVATENRTLYAKWSDIRLNLGNATPITKEILYTEEGAIFNFKSTTVVTAGENQVLKMPLPADTYKGFTMKICFNECTQADGKEKVYIRPQSTSDRVYLNYKWLDENGVEVAEADREIGQWYTFVATMPSGGATNNIWVYLGNLATQNLTKLDVSIKDLVGIPLTARIVTMNHNYTGGPTTQLIVADGTTVGSLPKPEREGYQFFGWFNSANAGTPVADTTAITADTSLYALWNVDPAIWGGTFTYLAQNSYGYYVRVTAEEVDGESEPVLQYASTTNVHSAVAAENRAVQFNVNAAAGDIISLKVKIASVKNVATGSTLESSTIAIYNAAGSKQLLVTFVDEQTGEIANALTVGQWYTIIFVSDGSGKYQFRPFADKGDSGSFYMKDIAVLSGSGLQGDSAVSLGAAIVDGEIVYNYKTSGTNTAQTRILYFKNDGTHQILTYKIKFTESSHADYAGFKGYIRHNINGTLSGYKYPVITDEAGKVIATDSASCAANIKPDVWYTVTLDAGTGAVLSSNIWTYFFDTDAKYDNATVEFEIKDIEYPDDVQTKHKVTFNWNYEGAPATATYMIADGTKVGDLPTPTRDGYVFVDWFKGSSCTGNNKVGDNTDITSDLTLYALWAAEANGSTFTYDSDSGMYYAKVYHTELNGEKVLQYETTANAGGSSITPGIRKVWFNNSAAAGNVISMKVMFPEGHTAGKTLAIYGSQQVATVFTDESGNVVSNADLVLGKWYTVSWISDGSGKYQIRPFDGNGAKGTFYMKDIKTGPLFDGITITTPGAMADPYLTYSEEDGWYFFVPNNNNKISAYERRAHVQIPTAGANRLVYEVRIDSVTDNAVARIGIYQSEHVTYYDIETGAMVGEQNAVTLQIGKWYRVVQRKLDGTTLGNDWLFGYIGNAGGEGNASASFRNFKAIYSEEVTVGFNLNYEGAPAYGETKSVTAYGTYGTLPMDATREGYAFAGWYLDAACTKPVNANTLVTKSHTLYAKWNAAVSFTRPHLGSDGNYYVTLSQEVQNGETIYKYVNTQPDANRWPSEKPGPSDRKAYMAIANTYGETISMDIKIDTLWDVNKVALATGSLEIRAGEAGEYLKLTFKDKQTGAIVPNGALVVGTWYTLTFTATGMDSYTIYPFDGYGTRGAFSIKNIQVIKAKEVADDFNPTLRFAVTSDVHVYNYHGGTPVAKRHLSNLFNVAYGYANMSSTYKNLDAVLVAGDISEGHVDEFETFKQIVDSKIQDGTQLLVSMGNHDFRLDGTETGAQTMVEAFEARFGEADKHVLIKGANNADYHFISLSPAPENLNGKGVGESYTKAKLDWLKAELDAAVADMKAKGVSLPIFVMQHHHVSDTVYGSEGDTYYADLKALLNDYPMVVDFSGHSHRPVNDPRNVWQDAFTAIGTGTLFYVGVDINGDGPDGITPDGYEGEYSTSGSKNGADYGVFQIVEVNADNDIRIIVYDLRTFEELYRFVIENPVDPANHVTNEQKAEASKAPEFALGAEVEVREVDGISYVYVPQAISTEVIESYRAYVTVNGVTTTYYGLSGYVYPNQPEYARIKIGSLDTTKDYRIEVVAVNAYGKTSEPLVMGVVAPTADITFDLNYDGAPAGPDAITLFVGEAYGELPTPTRAQTRTTTSGGYTFYYGFAGWYTNAECTGEAVKPSDIADASRTLYAKWVKASLMPRVTNSVYSDPTLQYIEGEWVYVYANNGTAMTNAEQERMNLHLPEKVAYAVSYKVMLTNETDAALFYKDSGNLGVDIYDANGVLLYKRNYLGGGTSTQITLEEGEWYTIVHSNRDSSTYYLTGTDYFGLGVYGDGAGGATMYVKDIEIATENAPSTAAVDVYTNNINLYPNRNLRVIDGEWAWVFAGNQAQTTQSGRFLRFNIKTGPVSKVTFKLMADNCTGDVVLNYAQVGSAAVTFKDPDGNTVDWDKLQTGVWYDCVFTRATAMAAAADWSIGYFGTGTGGMDIYFKDIQLVPAE